MLEFAGNGNLGTAVRHLRQTLLHVWWLGDIDALPLGSDDSFMFTLDGSPMINRLSRILFQCLSLVLCLVALRAEAEPYLAVQMGLKCGQCHVNPTGGGLRTTFGDIFAQTLLPQNHIDTGPDNWTGDINKFLRIGGDLRFDATVTQQPGTKTVSTFDLEQARVYLEANVIPERLIVYADELVAPNGAMNREAYGMYWSANHDWYVKAGQMYLPFGLRLQDVSAFVQVASGINMAEPDQGVEFGWERGHWDAQLNISNGNGGGPDTENGKQYGAQVAWVESIYRLGVAANFNNKAAGNRTMFALFGGLHTGPIAWLAQAEFIRDQTIATGTIVNGTGQRQVAGLLEANWLIMKGNNLKLTAESYDPDLAVRYDNQPRWSAVYEWTPIQFVQLRSGLRINDGAAAVNIQHVKTLFVELHGFF
jgi:hypothetical protein